jgi:excisionase family DNA binding protein
MQQPDLEQLLAPYPDTLTVAEVAAVLRVHQRSIQRWAREGRVASVRVGRSYRFLRADILKWMHAARIPEAGTAELS